MQAPNQQILVYQPLDSKDTKTEDGFLATFINKLKTIKDIFVESFNEQISEHNKVK